MNGFKRKTECGYPKSDVDRSSLFSVSDFSSFSVFPGFCDVHVHFREPGFSYKETIASGSAAAAHGGYTAVCTMPNLSPVPDSIEHLQSQSALIRRDSRINIYPYASITEGERGEKLVDMSSLAPHVIAFSDDGHGVQSDEMMREAMQQARSVGKMIVAHCEVNSLLRGGYIHDGVYAKEHGHRGICSQSEYAQIERDLMLASETHCAYHVCHISAKESVSLIREAKKCGIDVSCETAPHYLLLSDRDLEEDGRWKMNPPLRDESDREALLEGIFDGTIDMIATDHAPHTSEEKARGLEKSLFGIVGLETAFPVLYTELVTKNALPLDKLLDLMAYRPRQCFQIPLGDDFCVWDLNAEYEIDPACFLSMGKATPFAGRRVFGKCIATFVNGKQVY